MPNLKISQATAATALLDAHEFPVHESGTSRKVSGTQIRTSLSDLNFFRLTANGSAIGPTIADFFGSTSSLPTSLNGVYELFYYLNFLKTTAGTVTFTLTNTQAYTNLTARYDITAAGGIAAQGAAASAGIVGVTTAAAAMPASASLTTAVNHQCWIRALAEVGTAGNIRLRVTSSAGTVTPLRGSYYSARLRPAGNVGTFVA